MKLSRSFSGLFNFDALRRTIDANLQRGARGQATPGDGGGRAERRTSERHVSRDAPPDADARPGGGPKVPPGWSTPGGGRPDFPGTSPFIADGNPVRVGGRPDFPGSPFIADGNPQRGPVDGPEPVAPSDPADGPAREPVADAPKAAPGPSAPPAAPATGADGPLATLADLVGRLRALLSAFGFGAGPGRDAASSDAVKGPSSAD